MPICPICKETSNIEKDEKSGVSTCTTCGTIWEFITLHELHILFQGRSTVGKPVHPEHKVVSTER